MKHVLYATLLCAGLFAGCEDPNPPPPAAPDNTGSKSGDTRAPMTQSGSVRDTEITAAIERFIDDDPSMSADARNCTIGTANGVVTLRGMANSQAEKDAIDRIARSVPGVVRVDNKLEVKTP